MLTDKLLLPSEETALPGRDVPMSLNNQHAVHGRELQPPFPDYLHRAVFGLGCFWGAERRFWSLPGVYTTAVGYAAGITPNPTYEEVCSGLTGHNEVVLVVFDPETIRYSALLKEFFEAHNPTQGMRQGNDIGTQYRSGIYFHSETQRLEAQEAIQRYQSALTANGAGMISTELVAAGPFFYAEDYHQQYLHKNPNGYCGLGGTGIEMPCG